MDGDSYCIPEACKYPCQLQVGKFSLQFVLWMEMEWDSSKEEKSSPVHHAVSGGGEWREAEWGKEGLCCTPSSSDLLKVH